MTQTKDPAGRRLPDAELPNVARLIRTQRWATLSTVDDDGFPLGAMVAYAPIETFSGFFLHTSRLSRHTRNLLARDRAALTIAEPDLGKGDPQTLSRLCIQGRALPFERETDAYETAKRRYLAVLPDAEQLFGFADFVLFNFVPQGAHYVGGFARAYRLDAARLLEAGRVADG